MIQTGYVAALVIACFTSLALAGGTVANEAEVSLAGAKLQLEDIHQVCHLKNLSNHAKSYSLAIPWPCNFHKSKSGEVRIIRSGKYEYILVESSKPNSERGHGCETYLRAIRASIQKVYISEHKDKVASCPPFQWDKMVFTELFN